MLVLRQDVKASLTVLFKPIRRAGVEKILRFIRDKGFLLKEMEMHLTNLLKEILQDVTGAEFKIVMDLLDNMGLFGKDAPVKLLQELIGIIETQVSDGDRIDRLIVCLVLPCSKRDTRSRMFLNYVTKHVVLVLDKLRPDSQLDLLKNLAECLQLLDVLECRDLLTSVVELLKAAMHE